jgi:hypothetical protein
MFLFFYKKNGWAKFWAIFFTNSSGRPACQFEPDFVEQYCFANLVIYTITLGTPFLTPFEEYFF